MYLPCILSVFILPGTLHGVRSTPTLARPERILRVVSQSHWGITGTETSLFAHWYARYCGTCGFLILCIHNGRANTELFVVTFIVYLMKSRTSSFYVAFLYDSIRLDIFHSDKPIIIFCIQLLSFRFVIIMLMMLRFSWLHSSLFIKKNTVLQRIGWSFDDESQWIVTRVSCVASVGGDGYGRIHDAHSREQHLPRLVHSATPGRILQCGLAHGCAFWSSLGGLRGEWYRERDDCRHDGRSWLAGKIMVW